MCDPITLTVLAVGASIATNIAANKAAARQEKALNKANAIQAEQISDAAGVELDRRARQARQERAAARVAASESGINLGSNSFLALLQESEVNQSIDQSLILKEERNRQEARQSEYESRLSTIQKKTGLGILFDGAVAGISAYSAAGGNPKFLGKQPGRG
jgi:hypothetical protein